MFQSTLPLGEPDLMRVSAFQRYLDDLVRVGSVDVTSTRLAAARTRVVRLAHEAGCRFAAEPQGLFGWVETGLDTEPLAVRMAAEGWLVAPGRLFHVPSRSSTLMRVNFASAQDARFWRAFERARDALR